MTVQQYVKKKKKKNKEIVKTIVENTEIWMILCWPPPPLPKTVNDFFATRNTQHTLTEDNSDQWWTTKADTGLGLLVSAISCFFLSPLITIVMAARCLGFIQSYSHLCQYLSVCPKIMRLFLVSTNESCFFFRLVAVVVVVAAAITAAVAAVVVEFFVRPCLNQHITFLPIYFHLYEVPIKTRITHSHRHVQLIHAKKKLRIEIIRNRRKKNNAKPFYPLVGIATKNNYNFVLNLIVWFEWKHEKKLFGLTRTNSNYQFSKWFFQHFFSLYQFGRWRQCRRRRRRFIISIFVSCMF